MPVTKSSIELLMSWLTAVWSGWNWKYHVVISEMRCCRSRAYPNLDALSWYASFQICLCEMHQPFAKICRPFLHQFQFWQRRIAQWRLLWEVLVLCIFPFHRKATQKEMLPANFFLFPERCYDSVQHFVRFNPCQCWRPSSKRSLLGPSRDDWQKDALTSWYHL